MKRVETKLRRQFKRLDAACDHRVIASLAYLRITEALRRDLSRRRPRFFRHQRWMAFVITDFSNSYFDGVPRLRARPAGARVLAALLRRGHEAATPTRIQDLLLFSNAHAQHDLPFSYASMGTAHAAAARRASTTTTA